MNILIADDDLEFIHKLKNDFISFFELYSLDLHFDLKSKDFYSKLENRTDVAFIDIDLGIENGLNYAKYIKKSYPDALLIFISNSDELVFQTLSIGIFQFIRKSKYDDDSIIVFNQLKDYIFKKLNTKVLVIKGCKYLISINEIKYILSIGRDILIFYKDRQLTIHSSIKDILDFFNSPFLIQIQRGMIVNYMYIKKINRNIICMLDGKEYKIGRKYLKNCIDCYEKLLLNDIN